MDSLIWSIQFTGFCTILTSPVKSAFNGVLYSILGPNLLGLTVAVWNIVGRCLSAVCRGLNLGNNPNRIINILMSSAQQMKYECDRSHGYDTLYSILRPFQIDLLFLVNWLVGCLANFKKKNQWYRLNWKLLCFFSKARLFFPGCLVGFSIPDLRETTNQFGTA